MNDAIAVCFKPPYKDKKDLSLSETNMAIIVEFVGIVFLFAFAISIRFKERRIAYICTSMDLTLSLSLSLGILPPIFNPLFAFDQNFQFPAYYPGLAGRHGIFWDSPVIPSGKVGPSKGAKRINSSAVTV